MKEIIKWVCETVLCFALIVALLSSFHSSDLVLERPNNRQDEVEADLKELHTLVRANYAQSAMISFMKKPLNSDWSYFLK